MTHLIFLLNAPISNNKWLFDNYLEKISSKKQQNDDSPTFLGKIRLGVPNTLTYLKCSPFYLYTNSTCKFRIRDTNTLVTM